MQEIVNQQKKIKMETADFKDFLTTAINLIPGNEKKNLTVVFVSDKKMRDLNFQYRAINQTTDVLSFPSGEDEFQLADDYLGDIAISAQQAQKQALENGLNFEIEIKQLILHGLLHLSGYDHETDTGQMNKIELELRDKLGINF